MHVTPLRVRSSDSELDIKSRTSGKDREKPISNRNTVRQSRSCVSQLRCKNEQCLFLAPFDRPCGTVNVRFNFPRLDFIPVYII